VASALITIDQPANTSPIGVAGRARDDLLISQPVTLRNADDTDVNRWRWSILDVPIGSAVTLSSLTASQVTFTPDVAGSYRVRLAVNDGTPGQIDTRVAAVRDVNSFRFPAVGEQPSETNWLVGGSPNEDGWGKDTEALLRLIATFPTFPGASTDNAVVRFDGITGIAVQNSLVLISDAGDISTPGSVIAVLVLGGDFGVGSGAGTAITLRGGDGGTTGGAGAVATVRGGDAQANNDPGGVLALRSGNSDGTADAPNITVSSGTSGSGDVGVLKLTNTCLEIAEASTVPGPTIGAGTGRIWVSDDVPSEPRFTDDTDVSRYLITTTYQPISILIENVTNGLASTVIPTGGLGYPAALSDILGTDWVDFTTVNVGSPPAINTYTFGTISGDGAVFSLQTVSVDLDTTGSSVGDGWALLLDTKRSGLIILLRITLV
jgi:hypothetical protein